MNHDSVNQRNPGSTQQTFPKLGNGALSQGESPGAELPVEPVAKAKQHGDFYKVMGVKR